MSDTFIFTFSDVRSQEIFRIWTKKPNRETNEAQVLLFLSVWNL